MHSNHGALTKHGCLSLPLHTAQSLPSALDQQGHQWDRETIPVLPLTCPVTLSKLITSLPPQFPHL